MFWELRKSMPSLGLVLDCCTRPSHDLGRRSYFAAVFGKMVASLRCRGVRKVVVACPNCFQIFRQYGNGLSVSTAYEYLETDSRKKQALAWEGQVSVHDPCALRDETAVHLAVRRLVQGLGLQVTEMQHHGRHTLCCGQGGMVRFINPGLAGRWPTIREEETAGRPIITYCAGCTSFLNKVAPAIHIADLLYRPEKAMSGKVLETRPPFTYLNRLLLKRRFKQDISRASRGR
jgi:Fe-S oxidoreductase